MSFQTFFTAFSKTSTDKAGTALIDAIGKLGGDEMLSEAAIIELDSQLNDILREVAGARRDYDKEQKEADAAQSAYDQKAKAAEILLGKGMEDKAMALLDEMEVMKADVDREHEEAEYAKQMLELLESNAKTMGEDLKNARKLAEDAKRDVQRAEAEEVRNKRLQDRAEVAAGLKKSAGGMSTAMESMQRRADEAKARAAASKMKADMLSPTAIPRQDDDVAAALAEAAGESPKPKMSAADRLAALKSK